MVRDAHGFRYCEDHRDWHESWHQLRHVFPAAAGVNYDAPSWSAEQEAPLSYMQKERMSEGVRYARRWTHSDQWRATTELAIRTHVGGRYYWKARKRGTARMCKQLEREAESLIAAKKSAEDVLTDLTERGLVWLTSPRSLASLVAAKFAEHVVDLAGGAKLDAVAKALRCFGIFICAVDDSVALADCYCLRPLVKDEVTACMQEKIKEVVRDGLEHLSGRARPAT